MTIFEAVGGAETFAFLVERFYEGVEADPVLRPLYPDDLIEPKRHLTLFLVQYFGGPQTYSAERGHPRLRMRHVRFPITRIVRDAWVQQMTTAMATLALPEREREEMQRYFADSATFLINQAG
ncbi:MAG: globin domain-containing protein [Dehalococcoidia bacterium]